jgi:hypothetical protein
MNELCPKCRIMTEVREETKEVERKDEKGKVQKVLVKNYFCTLCKMPIRTEETIITGNNS